MNLLILNKTSHPNRLLPVLSFCLIVFTGELAFPQVGVEDKVLSFETGITGDFFHNFRGGLSRGHGYMGMEHIILRFNTEAAGLWKGGSLIMHGMNTHGTIPSSTVTGDWQVFSNIEAGDHTGFYELAYFQKIGDFTLLLGQHDLNTEFVVTQSTDIFLNSSFGVVPTISLNVPVSIFPVTTPCLGLRWEPRGLWTFRGAVYNGNPGNIETNRYNLTWRFGKKEGVMAIGEAEMDRTHGGIGKGTLKIGGFYHTGNRTDPVDTTIHWKADYGVYFTLHRILLPSDGVYSEGVNAFIQFGAAPRESNIAAYFASAGIRSHGFFKSRTNDVIALSVAHLGTGDNWRQASPENLHAETTFELTYRFCITDVYFIQPDIQYIIHPGAVNEIKNALVATLRFAVNL